MDEKRAIDGIGATALIGFAVLLAVNQVVVKVTGGGFGPVFQAGLRSAGASVVIAIWMGVRGQRLSLGSGVLLWGVIAGGLFAVEFIFLFSALDLTSVSRASIIFYSMPVWLALAAHFLLPGERLNGRRAFGLAVAMAGVVLALLDRSGAEASLTGDLLALAAAFGWAGVALMVRVTPLARVPAETQLLLQVVTSAVILLALAPLIGDTFRAPTALHWAGLAFQAICVASLGYLAWFGLIKIYRANGVASFSFLSPVFSVMLGWALLGETIGPQIWGALALVALGIFLINRK